MTADRSSDGAGVYTQTNDPDGNQIIAYRRAPDGTLTQLGAYDIGGRGTGTPHLASQGSITLSDDGQLTALEGSRRQLSRPDADPAQIGFSPDGRSLVVTERATDSISSYVVDPDGSAEGPTVIPSSGATPYGFDFTRAGVLVVTEAAGGKPGAASASSYALAGPGSLSLVSGSVADTRSEVCWATVTPDNRHVYVTNFGDGTVSSYTIAADGGLELLQPLAGTTVEGQKGVRDEALSRDGRYLFALHADVQQLFGWQVDQDGSLTPVGAFGDLPTTVAGLAAGWSSWPAPTGLAPVARGRRLPVTDGGAQPVHQVHPAKRPPTSATFVGGVLVW